MEQVWSGMAQDGAEWSGVEPSGAGSSGLDRGGSEFDQGLATLEQGEQDGAGFGAGLEHDVARMDRTLADFSMMYPDEAGWGGAEHAWSGHQQDRSNVEHVGARAKRTGAGWGMMQRSGSDRSGLGQNGAGMELRRIGWGGVERSRADWGQLHNLS